MINKKIKKDSHVYKIFICIYFIDIKCCYSKLLYKIVMRVEDVSANVI
jgi:hypothetical protein